MSATVDTAPPAAAPEPGQLAFVRGRMWAVGDVTRDRQASLDGRPAQHLVSLVSVEDDDTRIVAEDGGIGRQYDEDPLGGRDDDGPIFPVGDVDPRLPVQAAVVGRDPPGRRASRVPGRRGQGRAGQG